MNKILTCALFLLLILCSCSSLESDAEEAAELTRKSITYTYDGDLEEAEKCFKECQSIRNKYIGTHSQDIFFEKFDSYLHP